MIPQHLAERGRETLDLFDAQTVSDLDDETLDRIDQLEIEIPNPMTEDGLRRL